MVRNALFIVAAAYVASVFMMKSVEGVPVKGDYTTQKTTSDISKLRDNAKLEVYKILQQMISLEHVTNRRFDLFHQICYKRSSAICEVDINTIKADVKSLTQLLPVVQQLVVNENDEYVITKYNEIIKFMGSSITALNKLVEALDNKYTTPVTPASNQQYEGLDKIVKLSILKLQVELILNDLDRLPVN